MRTTTSERQVAANRRNAQKSTGPRTPAGRAVSRMNACKHGIRSTQVLVCGLHLKESPREFKAIHQRFVSQLKPVGPVEEMLVDQIVAAHWRLRRVLNAESGEIALSVDQTFQKHDLGPDFTLQWLVWLNQLDPIASMEKSSLGNDLIMSWLDEIRQAVERDGELAEAAVQVLANHLGGKPNSLAIQLEQFRLRLTENPDGLAPAALRERNKALALQRLSNDLCRLQLRRKICEKREAAERQARQAAAELPSLQKLDRILRYESKLDRQMYRAMLQLERLQRMRQGEAVPPPLSMQVTDKA